MKYIPTGSFFIRSNYNRLIKCPVQKDQRNEAVIFITRVFATKNADRFIARNGHGAVKAFGISNSEFIRIRLCFGQIVSRYDLIRKGKPGFIAEKDIDAFDFL